MTPLKTFEEYVEEGAARKQSQDILRARSLAAESQDSYDVLLSLVRKMGIDDKNANHVIKNAYDIIMELVRAKMLFDGFGTSGKGAHEAEVAYMFRMGFSPGDVDFVNDLRYFRNGIMYYGKRFGREYAQKVMTFLARAYPILSGACAPGGKAAAKQQK